MDENSELMQDNREKMPEEIVEYMQKLKDNINKVEKSWSNNVRTSNKTITNFDLNKNDRLWEMKMKNEFVDAVIVTQDGYQEPVHMDMLLNLESNIKQCLEFQKELAPQVKEFRIDPSVSYTVLKEVIYFAYHGTCNLTSDNCVDVAIFAAKYCINSLVLHCINYFMQHCTPINAIKGFEFTLTLAKIKENNRSQCQFFQKFIEDNFEEIFNNYKAELLNLEGKLIWELLISPQLNLINESVVWNVIKEWIEFDQNNRIDHLKTFIHGTLRFGRLPEEYVRNEIFQSNVFKCSPRDVQESIMEFMQNQLKKKDLIIKDGYGLLYSRNIFYFQPRETKEIMLAAGGWVEGQTTPTIEIYDYQTNMWLSTYVKLPKRISYFGFEVIDNVMYIFGGSNGRDIFKSLETLNLNETTVKWEDKCSMIESRCYVSTAVLDGQIYAIGGFNQRNRIRKCERYHPQMDSWSEIADLNYPRSDASAVVHNGRIYIAGGINDSCIERSVEVYYPEGNFWKLVKSMASPRTSFAITSFQNKIWALGGNDGNKRSKSVECYNPENDTWNQVEDMLTRKSTFRAIVLKNELYVVGGYNGQSPICNVEKYVPNKGWIKVKELRHDRSGLSLLSLPNKFGLIKV